MCCCCCCRWMGSMLGYSIRRYISKQSLYLLRLFRISFRKGEIIEWKGYLLLRYKVFIYIHNIYAHNIFRNAKALQHIRRSQKERYVGGARAMRDDGYSLSWSYKSNGRHDWSANPAPSTPEFLFFSSSSLRSGERTTPCIYIYKVRCARLAVIFTTDNFSLFIHECVYTHTSRRLFLFIYFLYHNAYRHT